MDSVSSRELKNRTGEILGRVRRGERIAVTNRGRTVAVIVPAGEIEEEDPVPGYEEAWADITRTLEQTAPEVPTWQEAMGRSRRRH